MPQISPRALAAFGNALIKQKGLDFSSLSCAIAEANNIAEGTDHSENFTTFKFEGEDLGGRKIPFELMSKDWGYPCGCSFDFPLLSVNQKEWTVLADNQPVKLKRPKDFYFEEVQLVDKRYKKVIRRWYKPLDNPPEGISADGTKIYVPISYNYEIKLLLEISASGAFRFVPKNKPNIIKTNTDIIGYERSENDAYLGIKRFKSRTKSYYLKFEHPCT